MIQLFSSPLELLSETHLQNVRGRISGEATFQAMCLKAKSEWASKTSSAAAEAAFADIKLKLKEMCSGTTICVYCEHNEATDIEHIYPKRIFPNKAFDYNNYVLACGNCNTHYKKDNFKVFDPAQSSVAVDVTPSDYKVYNQPQTEDAVFINQRIEDPLFLLELDFLQNSFYFIERHHIGTREYEKASYTKEILGLNKRDDLVKQRKAAFGFYKHELARYIAVLQATNLHQLEQCIDLVIDTIDLVGDFGSEQQRLKDVISNRIKRHTHRTVWKEMIRQRHQLPSTLSLFDQAPEALNW